MPAHLTFLGVVLVVWASVMHSASGSAQVPLMLHLKQVSQPLVSLSQIQVDEVQELHGDSSRDLEEVFPPPAAERRSRSPSAELYGSHKAGDGGSLLSQQQIQHLIDGGGDHLAVGSRERSRELGERAAACEAKRDRSNYYSYCTGENLRSMAHCFNQRNVEKERASKQVAQNGKQIIQSDESNEKAKVVQLTAKIKANEEMLDRQRKLAESETENAGMSKGKRDQLENDVMKLQGHIQGIEDAIVTSQKRDKRYEDNLKNNAVRNERSQKSSGKYVHSNLGTLSLFEIMF